MSLKICILGSGSTGNCTYISSAETAILIDAGLSARQTRTRLAEIGMELEAVRGICVSHEHNDHITGLRVLHLRHGLPLYGNAGTLEGVHRDPRMAALRWNVFTTGVPFRIGDLSIEPFPVAHDAYDPVGFIVACGDARVGVATDMGVVTTVVRERLRTCHALVLESNHDDQLLMDSPRPWHLKQRIRGRQGHLSNELAAVTLAEIAGPHLRHVFLAHLSQQCNRAELALGSARRSLRERGVDHVTLAVSSPDRVSELWTSS